MADSSSKSQKDLEGPVTRSQAKEGKLLLKGVRKFLRYNDDLISDTARDKIEESQEDFEEAKKQLEAAKPKTVKLDEFQARCMYNQNRLKR